MFFRHNKGWIGVDLGAQTSGSVTLKGHARDNVAVATFVVSLRESGLFRRVELKSSVGEDPADEQLRTCVLQCDF